MPLQDVLLALPGSFPGSGGSKAVLPWIWQLFTLSDPLQLPFVGVLLMKSFSWEGFLKESEAQSSEEQLQEAPGPVVISWD